MFEDLTVEEACLHHAITAGKLINGKVEPNLKSVDKAHLNIYGAKYVAWLVASSIKNSNNQLKTSIKTSNDLGGRKSSICSS